MISIIVTTYNRVDALNAVLQGLAAQQGLEREDWEVLVADDGSGPDTATLVQSWQSHFPCNLTHVWHPDNGFRAAAIRNLSALRARGDQLVFMDGDCIPFPDFVKGHARLIRPGRFVAGNRVLLSAGLTQQLLESTDPASVVRWSAQEWMQAQRTGQCNRRMPWLRLPLGPLRFWRATQWKVLKSCNLGISTSDFLAVGGFDEIYSGWGREDSDLALRLIHAGRKMTDGRFAVPVLHLWHPENDRQHLGRNDERLRACMQERRTMALEGIASVTTGQAGPAGR
jgi:glycosyltransferase involved in cell wall biosynthesis